MVHYGLTKTAQLALSRGIAESVAGTGVTVNSVLPGPTRSEGAVDFLGKVAAEHKTDIAAVEEEFIRTMRPTSLIRRFAESEEGRKPGGISLRRRGLGDYRRFTASRWRRGAQHRLRREGPKAKCRG